MDAPGQGALLGGRYEIGDLLGVGGTGSVFEAADRTAGGAVVAVKMLHPHLCADPASRNEFLREARLLISFSHPNIVTVHDAGMFDAAGVVMPWIALDKLSGPTLREWVDASGPLTVHEVNELLTGLLSGLAQAHHAKVVHRDITPVNIVLERGPGSANRKVTADMVRIVDFGLAAAVGHSTITSARSNDAGAAQLARIVGNPAFLTPEHALGQPITAASDIYQAGAVTYYALTGQLPFPRESVEQLVQAHISAPPPVPSALVDSARRFNRVVTRAMAKDPQRRFFDVAQFQAAVAAAYRLPTLTATPDRTRIFTIPGQPSPDPAPEPAPLPAPPLSDGSRASEPTTDSLPSSAAGTHAETMSLSRRRTAPVAGVLVTVLAVAIIAAGAWAVLSPPGPGDAAPRITSPFVSITPTPVANQPSATPEPSREPTPIPSPAATTTAPLSGQPQQLTVPELTGSATQAEATLSAAGLFVGDITPRDSAAPADTVLSQHPVSGTLVPLGSAVSLTVASGRNTVPVVTGLPIRSAAEYLQAAGFLAVADQPATASILVVGTQPAEGMSVRVGISITLMTAPHSSASHPSTPSSTSSPSGDAPR